MPLHELRNNNWLKVAQNIKVECQELYEVSKDQYIVVQLNQFETTTQSSTKYVAPVILCEALSVSIANPLDQTSSPSLNLINYVWVYFLAMCALALQQTSASANIPQFCPVSLSI